MEGLVVLGGKFEKVTWYQVHVKVDTSSDCATHAAAQCYFKNVKNANILSCHCAMFEEANHTAKEILFII